MQEAQAREVAASTEASSSGASQPATTSLTVPAESTEDEEEALLAQAIKMSSEEDVDMETVGTTKPSETDAPMNEDDEDEEAAIARAIAMSMQQDEQDKK